MSHLRRLPRNLALVAPTGASKKDNPRYDDQFDSKGRRHAQAMPENVQKVIAELGKVSAFKMLNIVNSAKFNDLSLPMQFKILQAAMDRAYGIVTAPPKETLPPVGDEAKRAQMSSLLRDLALKADYPEMRNVRRAGTETEEREAVPVEVRREVDFDD